MPQQLISIIIPVYNTEKYLCKCLDSILAQTYTNWEAILVDDGSTDNSGKICDEYVAKDNRFKVIHQKNGGVSVARQTGLDNVTGDYIIHCDPDDWTEPTMFESLISKAIKENADMVICDFVMHNHGITNRSQHRIPETVRAREIQEKIINGEIHGSCWNKLIRKECCKDIQFFPPCISYCEDELFNLRLLCKDIKISYLPEALYHYEQHEGSNSTPSISRIISRIIVLEEFKKMTISSNDFFNVKKDILIAAFLSKNFKLLELYPEIHYKLITSGCRYSIFMPLKSNLSIALNGHPLFAYYMYMLNMFIIKVFNKFKRPYTKKKTLI